MDICQQKVHDDAMTWLQNSGKFIEQLGLTEECMALKNTVYYLVTFMNNNTKLDSGAFIGLCLPEECTV